MRKALLALLIASILIPLSSAELTPVPCEKWYDYPNMEMTVGVDYPSYSPGETVVTTATAANPNSFPVVEGAVRAQVIYLDGEEEYIIDEFYLERDLSILPNETIETEAGWQLPKNAKTGKYRIAVFFISSESFNLAGVSFLRRVYGAMAEFQVGDGEELLHFETGALTINGDPASLNEVAIPHEQGTEVTVRIPIMNEGSPADVKVEYELYSWDDLMESDIVLESGEEMKLAAGASKELVYTLPSTLPSDAYLLKIKAFSRKNNAIVKIRIPILGRSIKLNSAGLDKFPLTAGEPVTLFLCVSNSAESGTYALEEGEEDTHGWIEDGTLTLSLESGGRIVFTDSEEGQVIGGNMMGYETTFTPIEDYMNLKLKVEASDGGKTDAVEMEYDFDKLFKDVGVSLETSVAGQKVTARIGLEKAGYPVNGLVSLYAKDSGGAVSHMEMGLPVEGSYETSFSLPPGTYKIKAVEMQSWNDAEAEVTVKAAPPPPKAEEQPEAGQGNIVLPIILLILIFMAILFYAYSKSKK